MDEALRQPGIKIRAQYNILPGNRWSISKDDPNVERYFEGLYA